MKKEDAQYIKNIVKKVAEIQAPTLIDPYNTDLNGEEVSQYLNDEDNDTIENLTSIINEARITRQGSIHEQDKRILANAGIKLSESKSPEQQDSVFITATILTTEDKSMPDNYGTHKVTVRRQIFW